MTESTGPRWSERAETRALALAAVGAACALVLGARSTRMPKREAEPRCDTVESCLAACDRGQPAACRTAGEAYNTGAEVAMDKRRAAGLFAQACEGGDGLACRAVGGLYALGQILEGDAWRAESHFGQAEQVLTRSCDSGEGDACSALAELHQDPRWAGRSAESVQRLWERAWEVYGWRCGDGDREACVGRARLLAAGQGVERDPVKALAIYDEQCEAGSARAVTKRGAGLNRRGGGGAEGGLLLPESV